MLQLRPPLVKLIISIRMILLFMHFIDILEYSVLFNNIKLFYITTLYYIIV